MSPETKYNLPDPLLFFNYHEFLTNDYTPIDGFTNTLHQAIVVNHFPNVHVPVDSATYAQTRIIRIPRVFDTTPYCDLIPQFSTHIPGKEPSGIIKDHETRFEAAGTWRNSTFGASSLTPLCNIIDMKELIKVVETINDMIYDAYYPYSVVNTIESVLDVITGSLYSVIFNDYLHSKRTIKLLDKYITEVNEKNQNFYVINPRDSGFLSLDIQFKFSSR